MRSKSLASTFVLAIGIFAVLLTLAAIVSLLPNLRLNNRAVTATSPTLVTSSEIVREQDFGAWSYSAVRGEKGLAATISYDNSSIESLNAYAEINKEYAKQLANINSEIEVLITFKTLVQADQFRAWVRSEGLKIRGSELRTVAAGGTRGTLGVGADEDHPLPQEKLDGMASGSVSGVYSTRAAVPAGRLSEIASDPLVFVVDLTPVVVRRDLSEAHIEGANDTRIHYHVYPLFWDMEDLDMVPRLNVIPSPISTVEPTGMPEPIITTVPSPVPVP